MPVEFNNCGNIVDKEFNGKINDAWKIIEKAIDDLGELTPVETKAVEQNILSTISLNITLRILSKNIMKIKNENNG